MKCVLNIVLNIYVALSLIFWCHVIFYRIWNKFFKRDKYPYEVFSLEMDACKGFKEERHLVSYILKKNGLVISDYRVTSGLGDISDTGESLFKAGYVAISNFFFKREMKTLFVLSASPSSGFKFPNENRFFKGK